MRVSGSTTIVGVVGWPVGHSLSPLMHNAAFEAMGLDWRYVPFAVKPDNLERATGSLAALGIRGINVILPHKTAIIPFLDNVDELARLTDAVNTVVQADGALTGYNTDVDGFARSLTEAGVETQGASAALLGAGGAARAVAVALARLKVREIVVVGRTPKRAEGVAGLVERVPAAESRASWVPWTDEHLARAVGGADLVVNATSIGMYPKQDDPSPVPEDLLRPEQTVCDIVYRPLWTQLLQAARRRGCRCVGGAKMLVYQGALGFRLWTGQEPPVNVMEDALAGALGGAGGRSDDASA